MGKNKTTDTKKKEEKKEETKIDRRKKENRRHIIAPMGQAPKEETEEPDEIINEVDQEDQMEEDQQTNKKGIKTCILYQCPICNPVEPDDIAGIDDPAISGIIAFSDSEDAAQHIKETHGVIVIAEDVEKNCIMIVPRPIGEKIVEATEKLKTGISEEESIQEKRFQAALLTPKDLEPKQMVSEARAISPDQVYRETVEKLIAPPGSHNESDVYNESISGGMIQVQMMKSFPINAEVIAALAMLKKYM